MGVPLCLLESLEFRKAYCKWFLPKESAALVAAVCTAELRGRVWEQGFEQLCVDTTGWWPLRLSECWAQPGAGEERMSRTMAWLPDFLSTAALTSCICLFLCVWVCVCTHLCVCPHHVHVLPAEDRGRRQISRIWS